MNMTSNYDVTNSAHQTQMTTICHWMKPPPMEIFCVRHCIAHTLLTIFASKSKSTYFF